MQRPCWSSRALRPAGHTARKLGAGAGVRTSAHAWRTHTPQGAGTYQAAKYQTTAQAPDDRRSLCPRLPDMPRTCMTSSTGAWTRVQPSALALESSPPRHRIMFAFKHISCVSCQAGVSTPGGGSPARHCDALSPQPVTLCLAASLDETLLVVSHMLLHPKNMCGAGWLGKGGNPHLQRNPSCCKDWISVRRRESQPMSRRHVDKWLGVGRQ